MMLDDKAAATATVESGGPEQDEVKPSDQTSAPQADLSNVAKGDDPSPEPNVESIYTEGEQSQPKKAAKPRQLQPKEQPREERGRAAEPAASPEERVSGAQSSANEAGRSEDALPK